MGSHTLEYEGMDETEDPEKTTIAALVRVDGGVVYRPAINRFRFGNQSIGTPSVKTSLTEDVYLTLLEPPENPDDPVVIRVVLQPLVTWLWIGGGLIAIGTALAAFPGRRRRPTDPTSASDPEQDLSPEPPSDTTDRPAEPVAPLSR